MKDGESGESTRPSRLCPDGGLTPEQEAAIRADARAYYDSVGEEQLSKEFTELMHQYEQGLLFSGEEILAMVEELSREHEQAPKELE